MSLAMLAISSLAHATTHAPFESRCSSRYVVKKGDTLWDISGRYLDNPGLETHLESDNKQIKINLIYPDDILLLRHQVKP